LGADFAHDLIVDLDFFVLHDQDGSQALQQGVASFFQQDLFGN
jgi:hypothetical protein